MTKEKANLLTKTLVEISRLLLGATFIFSGFVKSVDPYGTAYKIDDYLAIFGLSSFSSISILISFFLCALEFVMGAFMLLGIYRRWNSRLILALMGFMTVWTFYLAISNPVEDCGCFGDFLVITNWQTFFKNIILLACAIVVFIKHEYISNFFTGKTYWMAFLYIILFVFTFLAINYKFDPIFDFRPYKIGANIPEQMVVEKGKERIEESVLIYEKDGVNKEFSQDNFPWEDSTWTFVRMDTKTIFEGESAKIKDFTISKLVFGVDDTHELIGHTDITEPVLTDTNYVFLMISPFLSKMDESHLSHFEDVMNYANDHHYEFYCLTASTTSEIIEWEKANDIDFNFCRTDERTLKTIIRTNPGLILLKEGTIINKWADTFVPAEENLTKSLDQLSYSQQVDQDKKDRNNIIYISIIFVLPLLLLKGLDLLLFRRKEGDTKKKAEDKKEN